MKLNQPITLITLTLLFSLVFISGYSQSKKELKTINKGVTQIQKTYDEFDERTDWSSPILKNIVFIKIKDKDGSLKNYLRLSTLGSTLNVGEEGFTLIFEDGTRFERPNAKVDANASSGAGWSYNVFVSINNEELSLFAEKKIKAYKLFIYQGYLSEQDKLLAMGWAKGIINSN